MAEDTPTPETPPACEYHGRPGCQACNSLRLALKAEEMRPHAPAMMETSFRKAVEHEIAGK